jgi:dihydroorotase
MPEYDLLLRGGTVIDPAAGVHALKDLAVTGGKIAAMFDPGTEQRAREVVDVGGLVVVPGLIDMHVHVFPGVSHFGLDPDSTCLARGVTTAVDFGTAGGLIFDGFRKLVIDRVETRLFALLHIAGQGLISSAGTLPALGELSDLRYCNVENVVRTVERHRDCIVGIKIRLTENLAEDGKNEAPALQLARQAADETGLPLVIHSPDSTLSMSHVLENMRTGDVLTHCYHGRRCGIVDDSGRVLPEAKAKLDEGLLMDVGHGWGSFSWPVAQSMLDAGVLADFISSDLHTYNLHGPVFDLLTTMDKFLVLGMSLDEVIRRTTAEPAKFLNRQNEIGTLAVGATADITVLEIEEGEFPLKDSHGVIRYGTQQLEVRHTYRAGRPTGLLPRPVEQHLHVRAATSPSK